MFSFSALDGTFQKLFQLTCGLLGTFLIALPFVMWKDLSLEFSSGTSERLKPMPHMASYQTSLECSN